MTTDAGAESAYAWLRLAICVLLSTVGGISLWSVVVVLPAVQAEFGVDRATASLPYTLTMIGFGVGGVAMGRMADRFGIMLPALIGAVALSLGYIAAANATSLWQFALAHGLLIALLGGAASFGPIVADISHWFTRRRGIAVAIAASGNYLAGAIWPPLVQHFVQTIGWRQTHLGIGVVCAVTMIPLALALRRKPPAQPATIAVMPLRRTQASLGMSPDRAAGRAVGRRLLLLRRDVDAAGAHRRLLRRSRLRRHARRGDAVADARSRHRQPRRVRLHRR